MLSRLDQAFNIRPGERRLVGAFFLLLALDTAAIEGANVVAVSSYIETLGIVYLPLVWISGTLLTLVSSACYSLIADRFQRLVLIRWLLIGFGIVFLGLRLLLSYGIPAQICYTLLYIIVDQQVVIFPLAFWAFANDNFNVAASKRLFPLIAAGGLIGNVLGNWFAGVSSQIFAIRSLGNDELLILGSFLFFISVSILGLTFGNAQTTAVRTPSEGAALNLREDWNVGMEFVRDVPLFRYLALLTFCNWLIIPLIDYYFLSQAFDAFAEPARFQAFYGSFKAVLTIASLLVQLFLAGRLLEALGLKNMFFALPATLALGSIAAAIRLDFASAALNRFLCRVVVETIDEPAIRSVQGLVPDARRGRVSTFLDSYVYGAGWISGASLLGLGIVLQQTGVLAGLTINRLLMIGSVLIALLALLFAWRLRVVYDQSLLNWRLSRRKRRAATVELDL